MNVRTLEQAMRMRGLVALDKFFPAVDVSCEWLTEEEVAAAQIDTVPVDSLVCGEQKYIGVARVKAYAEGRIAPKPVNDRGCPHDLPFVIKLADGRHLILEGHHRAAAALLTRRKTLRCRVLTATPEHLTEGKCPT
jgi:hypothetical protein